MSLFFGGGGKKVKPQFTGLQAQTSTGAIPIPLVYGMNRIGPNIIWQGDFKAHKQKQKAGKGGGSVTSYTYSGSYQLGICWGEINNITRTWKEIEVFSSFSELGFTLAKGTNPQSPWGYLTSNHPDQALGYPDIAVLSVPNYDLGQSNSLPQHSFEVEGLLFGTGVGGYDADPALVIQDFLGNPVHGVGFDISVLSNLLSTPDASSPGDSAFQTYCTAMGFEMSPAMTGQEEAGQILSRWANLCNTALVWTGSSLKFHPYGSDEVTANGVTYIPNFPIRYFLTDDDFIYSDGEDPVQFDRSDVADAFNEFNLIIANRSNEYNDLPIPWKDQGLIDQYGLKNDENLDAKEITSPEIGAIMVTFMGQRKAYVRNVFEFSLGPEFCLIEPMDVLHITDERLGEQLVMVREIEETDDGNFEIIAEEYIASISAQGSNAIQGLDPNNTNANTPPGPVNPPILIQPPPSLTNQLPQIWAAVSGGNGTTANPNWGGCQVWLSTDGGTSYNMIGDIDAPARMGALTAGLAAYGSANPDNTNTLKISSAMSAAEFTDATSGDAAAGVTLMYIAPEGSNVAEYLSYTSATLTGSFAYDVQGMYRGLHGSTPGAHGSGAKFARLDPEAIFKYDFPLSMIGETIYVKFVSYNIWGAALEDIASVTPYSITLAGGYEYGVGISGLTDVDHTSPPANGQVLVYDSGSGLWVPGKPINTATVITKTGASYNLDPAENSQYQNWTSGFSKTLTVLNNSTTAQPNDGEWHIRNSGTADLTIVADTGVTITPPFGGTLVIPQNGTVTLKRISANVFQLFGVTVPV